MTEPSGVIFPPTESGTGVTSSLGRAVVADALRAVDPIGAAAAQRETDWRRGYLVHFRRLVEAGLGSGEAARRIATDGLASVGERMRFRSPEGAVEPLTAAFTGAVEPLTTATVGGQGRVDKELTLPYRGERLRGDGIKRRLDVWLAAGIIEPSCAEAVRAVQA
ncbi:hypothetical protein AB0H87_35695, partial [Asanoa sp. NPDC050611]